MAAYIRGASHRTLTDAELAPYVAPWLGESGPAAFSRQMAQMQQTYTDEIEGRYGEVRCPTLILWGEEEVSGSRSRGGRLQRLIPAARWRSVPAAGHLVQEDAPEAIVDALLRFLPNPGAR